MSAEPGSQGKEGRDLKALWYKDLLGGPWDLVTTYNWAYNPTCNWGNPYKPIWENYK